MGPRAAWSAGIVRFAAPQAQLGTWQPNQSDIEIRCFPTSPRSITIGVKSQLSMKLPACLLSVIVLCASAPGADLRVGLIGCDTSHVPEFTEILNNPQSKQHVGGARVVAAFKGGSRDIESSWSRVDGYAKTLK